MLQMEHFGANIYADEIAEQNSILLEAVMPWATPLLDDGTLERFFFDRFDARGPHLVVMFGNRTGEHQRLAKELGTVLERDLAARGQLATISPETRELRHQQCRGKWLCEMDREEGFAEVGTFRIFDHPVDGYPFELGSLAADGEHFLRAWLDLSRLAVARLKKMQGRADWTTAIRLVAGIDRALRSVGKDPALLWRHHAATLLPAVKLRLESEPDAEILSSVEKALSDKNRQIFIQFWDLELDGGPELVRLVQSASQGEWGTPRSLAPLREIQHTTLKQLGLMVAQHVPLILFAWQKAAAKEDPG